MSKITWVAVYKDGTVYPQYENEEERSTETIDRKNLRSLILSFDGKIFLTQHFEPGQRMIFRRRGIMKQGLTGPAGPIEYVYLVGWQKTVGKENVQHIAYIFESTGKIELAGRFKNDHPFDEPKWLPCDEQAVDA